MRRWAALGAAPFLLALIAFATPASGAGWLPAAPVTTSGETAASSPSVAVAPDGSAAVVWLSTLTNGNNAVRIATRPAGGGAFGAPENLQQSASAIDSPDVAINSAGDVIAAWSIAGTVRVSVKPVGQVHKPSVAVASGTYNARSPAVGIDSAGAGSVVTEEDDSTTDMGCSTVPVRDFHRAVIYPVTSSGAVGAGTTFASTQGCLIDFPSVGDPVFAMNGRGDAVAATTVDSTLRMYSRSLTTGVLGSAGSVAGGYLPSVDMAETGRYAVFALVSGKVQLRLGTAGSAAGGPIELGDPAIGSSTAVGLDGSNNALALWDDRVSGNDHLLYVRSVAASGTPGAAGPAVTPQYTDAQNTHPVFDVGSSGAAFLLWRTQTGPANTSVINALVRSAAGVFGPLQTISGDQNQSSAEPVVGADGRGDALAAFVRPDNTADRVMVSQYDGIAPAITPISGPAAVTTGQSAAYSVTASDDLSGVTVHWDFGDGSGADATDVTHTFAAPGSPVVTASARDAAGNESSQTLAVTVTAPPPVVPIVPGLPAVPTVSSVSVSPRTFAVAPGATAVTARRKVPRGTHIRFKLAAAATAVLRFERPAAGRRGKGGKCVKPTRSLRKAKRCTRYISERSLTRKKLAAGSHSVAFTGRVGKKALRRGRHRVVIKATSLAGPSATGKPASFTIVRG